MAADPTIDSRRRFTVDEYELIGRAGVLGEARTELLDGEIIAVSPIGARQASPSSDTRQSRSRSTTRPSVAA
jgi:hypothetical protein